MAEATLFYGTGRRKTSVARVWLRPGGGRILINRRPFEDYFPRETLRMVICQPLQLTNTFGQFDAMVNVGGGGPTGQAGAVRHGIARAATVRRQAAPDAQACRAAHPRPADEGAEEVRPAGRPVQVPVLQAVGRACSESPSREPAGTWERSCCACSPSTRRSSSRP